MLFNSFIFIGVFLPVTYLLFSFTIAKFPTWATNLTLIASSLFFYSWWNIHFTPLILGSISVNYILGRQIQNAVSDGRLNTGRKYLVLGIMLNLSCLGFFKYATFVSDQINMLSGAEFSLPAIALPLAISFFTFQQIAFLVDSFRQVIKQVAFLKYALFVLFFPQLIAGPIVHHTEMMPQFDRLHVRSQRLEDIAIGFTIFVLGLAKKVLLADTLSGIATPVFTAAADGQPIDFTHAWIGALAYSMQLYFDFSGYSDMAVGLARIFGITLPINFFSPYKAHSIITFWRRWHITLSRFLRDYLYIPLGGNRRSGMHRYGNIMVTMVLGGLWHGAGWTFILWGAAHGLFILINHAFRKIVIATPTLTPRGRGGAIGAQALTFLAVVFAWVLFRADSVQAAMQIYRGMIGLGGVDIPTRVAMLLGLQSTALEGTAFRIVEMSVLPLAQDILVIQAALLIVLFLPNISQFMNASNPVLHTAHTRIYRQPPTIKWAQWRPTPLWGGFILALFISCLIAITAGNSEFLYYEF